MLNKTIHPSHLFIALFMLLSGCIKDKKEISKNTPTQLIVDNNTVIADDNTNARLVEVKPDQLIYSGSSTQLGNLVEGNILVSGITANAPHGYLRKILSISHGASQVVLNTQQATFEQAIKQCNISYSHKFTINDTLPHKTQDLSFTNSISQVIYTAPNGNELKLEGEYTLDPNLLLGLNIQSNHIEYVQLGMSCTQTANLRITGDIYSSPAISHELEFMNYTLEPIVLPVSIFGIPIVIVPHLKGTAGVNAQLSAQVSAGITGSFTQQAYIEYTASGGWNPVYQKSFSPIVTDNTLSGTAEAKAYVQAELEFTFYDLDAFTSSLDAEVYAKTEGNCSLTPVNGFQDCNWNINGGLSADANIHAEVFGWNLLDYTVNIFDYNKVLYEVGNNDSRILFNLSNPSVNFTYPLNDCHINTDTFPTNGSHNDVILIADNTFNAYAPFEIRDKATFEGGNVVNLYYSSDSFTTILDSHTIQLSYCTRFGNSNYVDEEFEIFNQSYRSNVLKFRIYKPAGANKNTDNAPATIKPSF